MSTLFFDVCFIIMCASGIRVLDAWVGTLFVKKLNSDLTIEQAWTFGTSLSIVALYYLSHHNLLPL